ncbi:hypothetical protein [Maribacter sp. HTCC2170]|uniref:hypothetical protein n=1 Tax=Maribacter sp. (strain HTCC2170 / KCCM 42371) TaxID=313603 RepID=UPI00006B48A2|nr:hypothetical protein [Maribacter sp. HTCC2170]EAR01656.1 hypothetical protein FB2170_14048 [Maribacter sp. HTCC2170]
MNTSRKVTYQPELNLVEIKLVGINTAQDVYDVTYEAIKLSEKYNSLGWLVNSGELIVRASRAELFELPNKLYSLWNLNPTTKIAIIEPKETHTKAKAHFYILATNNLGWQAEIFSSGRKAILWLQET